MSRVFEYVQIAKSFPIKWVAEDGRVVSVDNAKPTREKDGGFFSKGRTINIFCGDSEQIRKVNILTIVELNGMEVYI